MEQHKIDLKEVIPHGKINAEYNGKNLCITTQVQNNQFHAREVPINSYIIIPGKYKLPVRIDIRAKIDVPSMYVIFGIGHVTIGTSFLDNRRLGDIIEPTFKKTSAFNNKIELDVFFDCSIIYDLKFMQILINGEEKYYSKNEKYIKSPLMDKLNAEGFELKIAGSKQSNLTISSIMVTEFEKDELTHLRSRQNIVDKNGICLSIDRKAKSDFDECISMLSSELKKEIISLNDFLLSKKNLKIKRKIEGTSQACKINYVSNHGFSYAVHVSENITDHFFWWYMVSNFTYENKYMGRKNDLTKETLIKVAETSPEIAKQLFSYYKECSGCCECAVKTIYEHDGSKKTVCHGKMIMNMKIQTFQNMQYMFKVLSGMLK